MAEDQDKSERNRQAPDKSLARRDRQAQLLRQNLQRRKAQARERSQVEDKPAGDNEEPDATRS